MIGAGFSWSALNPSRERRSWLVCAAALSAALASTLLLRFVADPSLALGWSAGCALVAAVAAYVTAQHPGPRRELRLDADGSIWCRPCMDPDAPPDNALAPLRLLPNVIGRRLVTFRSAAGPRVVWADSLTAEQFRRLCANSRWHVERSAVAKRTAGTVPQFPRT